MPQANTATEECFTNGQSVKRRAACDECRTKKLKCTGEHPRCSRCAREGIECVYSAQKQMGRPKKRAHAEDEPLPVPSKSRRQVQEIWEQPRSGSLHDNENNAFDIGPYESAFTPGGSLQPWLQNATDWNGDYSVPEGRYANSHRGSENGVPGLTPDNGSSHSPPMLNLPPELQTHYPNSMTHRRTNHRDSSTAILLDPALAGPIGGGGAGTSSPDASLRCHPTNMPSCACLSSMYLTLNTLQGMDTDFIFPFALHPLREAMQTASAVLSCEECPKRFITAIQNTQLIGTLLMSIAERFSKVLEHTTNEAIRASEANETKKFRLADLNTSTSHLHTGGLGCVAAFSLDLSPDEWRKMCKKVVRAEVHGPESGNECCCYFTGVLKQMEERQERWHNTPVNSDFPRDKAGSLVGGPRAIINRENDEHNGGDKHGQKRGDHLCLKLVDYARSLVNAFDWS